MGDEHTVRSTSQNPTPESVLAPAGLELSETADGLALTDGTLTLCADLTRMIPRLKQQNLHRELIVKAAKVKGIAGAPVAVDATAGLGEDALLLAAAGFEVEMFERNPVIAALLEDALQRAAEVPELSDAVSRMHLHAEDSIEVLGQLDAPPDVVYLDPMFPERQKSAAVKKKFQLLHKLEGPCKDQEALLQAALDAKPRKVIVKRPLKAPYLAGIKPSYALSGKEIRYDCIVIAR